MQSFFGVCLFAKTKIAAVLLVYKLLERKTAQIRLLKPLEWLINSLIKNF